MIKCRDCKNTKEDSCFHWRNKEKGTRQTICKPCFKVYRTNHYRINKDKYRQRYTETNNKNKKRNKEFVWDYLLNNPCVDCGENDPIVLEFDHVRGDKRNEVGKLAHYGCSITTIQEEIGKCEIRCSNCHKRKTAKQFGYYKYLGE